MLMYSFGDQSATQPLVIYMNAVSLEKLLGGRRRVGVAIVLTMENQNTLPHLLVHASVGGLANIPRFRPGWRVTYSRTVRMGES